MDFRLPTEAGPRELLTWMMTGMSGPLDQSTPVHGFDCVDLITAEFKKAADVFPMAVMKTVANKNDASLLQMPPEITPYGPEIMIAMCGWTPD